MFEERIRTPLGGRVAVVTGASGAIGGAICRVLARNGATIVASGRNVAALDVLAADVRALSGSVIVVAADATDARAIEDLRVQAERQAGPVDLLAVVAGGGGEPVPLADITLERWKATIDLNLTSAFLTLKTFLPGMAERRRGSVVTVSSVAGQHVVPQAKVSASPAYAVAKAGLLMLTRQAAREYAPRGVRINCISPGSVDNDRIRRMPSDMRSALDVNHPLGRIGRPEDVADAAAYLLGDAAEWLTGATLDVNGGFAML